MAGAGAGGANRGQKVQPGIPLPPPGYGQGAWDAGKLAENLKLGQGQNSANGWKSTTRLSKKEAEKRKKVGLRALAGSFPELTIEVWAGNKDKGVPAYLELKSIISLRMNNCPSVLLHQQRIAIYQILHLGRWLWQEVVCTAINTD